MFRIGIFATGRGEGSLSLLRAIHEGIVSGRAPAEVAFVFSNREPGEFEPTDRFFEQVRAYGYPLLARSFRKFKASTDGGAEWRRRYDLEVARTIAPFAPDLCVLAGYLFIHGPDLCQQFPMVNLHPAAPGGPVGMWQDVIWELIHRRAASSGNTMLYVTEELDRGPAVTYCTFAITGPAFEAHWRAVEGQPVEKLKAVYGEDLPLFKAIRAQGIARERPLVVETIRAFALGEVGVRHGTVVDREGRPTTGADLTERIEALVAGGATL